MTKRNTKHRILVTWGLNFIQWTDTSKEKAAYVELCREIATQEKLLKKLTKSLKKKRKSESSNN